MSGRDIVARLIASGWSHPVQKRILGGTIGLVAFLVGAHAARACDAQTDRWVSGASNYWHGALTRTDYCNVEANGIDRQKAADCAWNETIKKYGPPPDPTCGRQLLENSSAGKADLNAFVQTWTAKLGASCSQASINAYFPHWHGALGKADYCNNASIGADREKAKACAFQALVRDKGVTPTSCLKDAIANSPQGKADLDAFVQTWQVATGADCSAASVAAFSPHWHGALGKAEYCNNASIGPDREKAKACAFQALVRDKGVTPTSCLKDAIANSPQGKADLDAFVQKWSAALPPYPPGVAGSQSPNLVPVLQRVLEQYRGCILENDPPEAPLFPARNDVVCLAGNVCDAAYRANGFAALQAQAAQGDPRNFQTKLQRIMLADCFGCAEHATATAATGYELALAALKWHTKHTHCTRKCGGNNGLDKGPCFETCKAGVDLEKWGFETMSAAGQGWLVHRAKTQMEGGPSVATNFSVVDPGGDEPCDATADGYNIAPPDLLDWTPTDAPKFKTVLTNYAPPAAGFDVGTALQGHQPKREEYNVSALQNINSSTPMALNIGANEGRLRGDLRLVAANANPSQSLCKAAVAFALGNTSDGKAFADLSVTGRRTFAAFKAQPPQEAEILRCLGANTSTAGLPDATKQHAAALALDRAYGVLNIIRAGRWPKDSTCRATRDSFGYIAVSGEDDQPHRPVNVPSAEFPQYDLAVMVRRPYRQSDLAVNTRYMIAHTVEPPNAERATCAKTGRTIPANRTPVLASDAEVILYVHGHDSNLEEALDLTRQIRELGIAQNKNYTVISMDLPTSGYADQIDPSAIAPLDSTGHAPGHPGPEDLAVLATAWAGVPAAMLHEVSYAPNGYTAPLVDFDEEFIVSFVNTLDRSLHGALSQRLRAIVGGSLGGNMAMRLGRPRADAPWVRNVVPWSPAGIWESLADDPTKHPGLAIPWYLAGGDATYAREDSGSRRSFFYGGFDWRSRILFGIPVGGARPQSEFWTDATWHCHQASMRLARIARFEVYNQNFRRWHWRLAMEQLQNSHWSRKAGTSVPLYLFNTRRTLLMCGIDDTGGDLCKFAQFMAPKMDDTPGRALFLTNTGHSIHDERPKFLARQIIDFIERP